MINRSRTVNRSTTVLKYVAKAERFVRAKTSNPIEKIPNLIFLIT